MNPPFQIKICGITTPHDALLVCDAGADAIGMNFYAKSPRFLDSAEAAEVAEAINGYNSENEFDVLKIGVFVNSTIDRMLSYAMTYSLDGIQLHGDESVAMVPGLKKGLEELDSNLLLIRAIRCDMIDDENAIGTAIRQWETAGMDAVLVDAGMPGIYGGTGKVIDWSGFAKLHKQDVEIPLVLAGGLNPENVAVAIHASGTFSIDVASGVESIPGVKDEQKVRLFVDAAKTAWQD